MPRKVSVQLDLDAAAYIAEAKAVDASTKAVDDQVKALGREADATGRDMDQLAAQAAVAKKEVKDLGDKAGTASAELKLLDTRLTATSIEVRRLGDEFARTGDQAIGKQLEAQKAVASSLTRQRSELVATTEKAAAFEQKAEQTATALKALDVRIASTKTLIHDLGVEFANTGDKATGKNLGQQRSLLSQLSRLRKDLTPVIPDKLPSLQWDFSGISGSLMPALVGVAVLAAPAIGAAVGGAVVGAVGLGGIAGGIFAASKDSGVQQAWHQFTSTLTVDKFGQQAFIKPAIDGIAELKVGFDSLHIGDIISKGAVAVPILAHGIASFAEGVMPGFNAVMGRAEDIANIFSDGLGNVGDALGGMIGDIAESKGSMDGLRLIFIGTVDVIRGTGAVVSSLGDAFHWSLSWLVPFSQATADALSWLPVMNDYLQHEADNLKQMNGAGAPTGPMLQGIDGATQALNNNLDPFGAYLATAHKNLDDLNQSMKDYLDQHLSVDQATLRWKEDILHLKEAVQQHGKSLSDTTQAGLDNQKMIQGLLGDAIRIRDATYQQTGSVDAANAAYEGQIDVLKRLLEKMGFTKDQIDKLVGDYQINIVTKFTYVGENAKFNQIAAKENRLDGRASGGPVGPGSYLVGEERPEILTLGPGQNGRVYPSVGAWQTANQNSGWKAMNQAQGGGGNRTITVIVKDTSGRTLRTEMIDDAIGRGVPQVTVAAAYP